MIKNIVSLSDLTLLKADQVFKKSILPLLAKDQVVDAKVINLISPSKAELLIMGKKVIADTLVPLIKGETLQLKVTEQGKLNILKLLPEPLNPSAPLVSHSGTATLSPGLPSLQDLALQLFGKKEPFEGFTKLTTALFSNIKDGSTLQGESQVSKQLLDKQDRLSADKVGLAHSLEQRDKPVADRSDITKMLISVALKSETADIDFLPNLLHKSGLLLEKKLSDMINISLIPEKSIKRPSSDFPKTSDSPSRSVSLNPSSNLSHNESSNLLANGSPALSSALLPNFDVNPPSHLATSQRTLIQEDIKGAILNLMANAEGESSEEIKVFHEFIQNLENVQLLNSHLSESGKYIIPFPLFNEDQFSFGQLFIDIGHKEEESGSSSKENSLLRVSLFLEMTRLGPIRADFSVLKENITGGFQVSDEEIAVFFRQMLPELKERLQIHDYHVHKINCQVVAPEKLTQKSIINELLKSEEHGFSVMI